MIDPSIDPRLVTDLCESEADLREAYQDSLGFWTIGRGHLLPKPAPGRTWKNFTISEDVSDRYFNGDVQSATLFAKALPEWNSCDTDCRQNALIELCFNMRSKWNEFVKAREAWLAKNWGVAHDELLHSVWAAQVQPHKFENGKCALCNHPELTGVTTYCPNRVKGRAVRLATYVLTGSYP